MFLVGFMASGKSSVGRALARLMGVQFMDTDAEIERASGQSVPRLFAERGEASFRALEERVVRRVARGPCRVVAVGGGAVTRRANVAAMRRSGTVVYISAPLELLWRRAKRDGLLRRPLLAGLAKPAMTRLLALRRPLYKKAAHLVVRGAGKPEDVARRILRRLP